MEGKNHRSYLLVVRERKSRLCLIKRLPDKEAATVRAALIFLLRAFAASHHTLTMDNGGEFAEHEEVAQALGKPGSTYFARPYRASDKGSIEELNARIRRRHPKGADFRHVSDKELGELQNHLNTTPLRVLGGRKPIDLAKHLHQATK